LRGTRATYPKSGIPEPPVSPLSFSGAKLHTGIVSMQKLKKDYYPLEEVAKEYPPYTVNDLLYFGETGQLQMCVVLPPTIVEITRLTPINELDENSYWAKLMNEPHEDSEKAKGEDLPEFIHECVKMGEIAGRYNILAVDVI
jgi:hypothetical protein